MKQFFAITVTQPLKIEWKGRNRKKNLKNWRERNLTLSGSEKGENRERERGYVFMVFFTLCCAALAGFFSDNTTTTKEIDAPLCAFSLATPRQHNEGSSLERSLFQGVVVVFLGFLSPKRTPIFLCVLLCQQPHATLFMLLLWINERENK